MAPTNSGLIGIFPLLVEIGNLPCIIKDYPIPVVPRKSSDGFVDIDPCHVRELMKGEVRTMLEEGQART
jgi:hypothetical protein